MWENFITRSKPSNLETLPGSSSRNAASTPESLDGKTTDAPITVKDAARFLGVSPSLVYAYVERKQIPLYRMMGRSIRFRLSELAEWRRQFHVNGGIDEQQDR